MKKLNNLFILIAIVCVFFSCEKKQDNQPNELETLRNSNNKDSYPAKQMDSIQALNSITQQKVQEVLDLSSIYLSGKRNTEVDTLIYNQMKSFFYKPDSLTFSKLFNEMDSMKAKSAKVSDLSVFKTIYKKDTLDYAKFNVEYFDNKNKTLGKKQKYLQYYLHVAPKQFQNENEFKYYLLRFYTTPVKDSTSSAVTR